MKACSARYGVKCHYPSAMALSALCAIVGGVTDDRVTDDRMTDDRVTDDRVTDDSAGDSAGDRVPGDTWRMIPYAIRGITWRAWGLVARGTGSAGDW